MPELQGGPTMKYILNLVVLLLLVVAAGSKSVATSPNQQDALIGLIKNHPKAKARTLNEWINQGKVLLIPGKGTNFLWTGFFGDDTTHRKPAIFYDPSFFTRQVLKTPVDDRNFKYIGIWRVYNDLANHFEKGEPLTIEGLSDEAAAIVTFKK